nr:MAG TPA: hypothetical protein [Caudoviricetes sp.]
MFFRRHNPVIPTNKSVKVGILNFCTFIFYVSLIRA